MFGCLIDMRSLRKPQVEHELGAGGSREETLVNVSKSPECRTKHAGDHDCREIALADTAPQDRSVFQVKTAAVGVRWLLPWRRRFENHDAE